MGYFNGSSYIEIPDSSEQTHLDGMSALTIECWLKADSLPIIAVILNKGGAKASYDFSLIGGNLTFGICVGAPPDGGGANCQAIGWPASPSLQTGRWYHIVGILDATTNDPKYSVYINAQKVLQRQQWPGIWWVIAKNSNPISIGRQPPPLTPYYFTGSIDNVRIYEEPLTSAQIEKLYVEGAKKYGLLVKE